MIDTRLVKKILNILLKSGGDFSEIFIQKKTSNSLNIEDGKIENVSSGFELGCGLRLISEDSTFYAYVDSLQSDKLINAAKILSAAVNCSTMLKALDLTKKIYPQQLIIKKYPSIYPQTIKSEYLVEVDRNARDFDNKIIQVSAGISDIESEEFIANSEGLLTENSNVKVFFSVNVIAEKKGEIRTGYKSIGKTCGYEIFDNKKPYDAALEAAGIAVKMLDAINAPAGSLPVVIGPGFGGVIFHEACGHGLEADAIVKDASVYKDKIGKKIANIKINAIDDPTIAGHWGSYVVDGEGFPSSKTLLIENGVLKSYITDLKSSKKLGLSQTGNGRRQSYRDIPLPRMSNTYIEKGSESPDDIIRSVKKGIFAKEFAGGQVDPATGDFVFGISEGYIIENGKISEPVKGATLIGNGPEILEKIVSVADNLDFAPGFCGKAGQSIANEVGQPTILVERMTVGGTAV
ncbi:MAG: TldD/PmbA family protein [Actinobacteria bacterium]|nr:TldD/PmbA family protein [Actinomycetota bacterium]